MNLRRVAATSVLGLGLLASLLPLRGVFADIVTTNIYIVAETEVEEEDAYVASSSARIDGTIDGDLVISTGGLEISGSVTGDVLVLRQGTFRVTGDVGGSLRGVARQVIVEGSVGDDVTVLALTTRLSGAVDRDALVFGGSLTVDGEVRRDVTGRMVSALIDGKIGNDVDIAVGRLTLGGATVVDGDVLYRSGSDASIAATAQVGSQLERLPTRGSFSVELVLTLATILGFFAFLFSGLVIFWLFRRTAPAAVAAVEQRPLRAAGVGIAGIIVLPLVAFVFVLTLVGAPVAIALLALLALALLFAPVPAVTALGSRLLRRRQLGLFAAFFLGAVIWRLGIWLIPLLGFALYLGALAAGLGGWLIAIWEQRRSGGASAELLPRQAKRPPESQDDGWEAPLAPPGGLESQSSVPSREPGGRSED